jgi:endonuclease/exonuclease/phosphatase (EEP) superfamily protein YafD
VSLVRRPESRRGATPSAFRVVGPLVGAAATAAALLPDRVGGARFPFAALAALRPHATATALAAATALATFPRARPLAVGVGSVALAGAATLGARTRRDRRDSGSAAGRTSSRRPHAAGAAVTELTVLAANVLVGRADTGALATVLEREQPDLVSLPEAGPDYRDKLLPLVAELGYRAWASTAPGTSDGEGVVLLAAARMGALTVTSGREMRHRYLRATGGALGQRSFYAVHPEAPMGPVRTARWRSDLAHIERWCAESPGSIVAGDFNATADNAAFRAVLRHCRSAADGTGKGLVGTFPANVPSWCGIQIDHVLVPADATTTRFAVLPVAGSDHRAVLAGISLPVG